MRGPTSRLVFLVVIVACLLLQLLSGSVVLALSVATTTPHNRMIRSINSSNDAKRSPYYNNNNAILLSSRQMSSSSTIASTSSNNGKLSFNPHSTTTTPKQLISILLCNMTRHFTNLRRSVIRATVIVSLILFGYTKAPIANAAYWNKSNNPDVVLVDTTATTAPKKQSSFGKKLTKLLVTAGAVSVGLSIVPNNGNGGIGNNGNGVELGEEEDGVLRVVPKDKPSPLPLPKVVVGVEQATTKPKPSPSNNTNNGISKDPILVKNLDSKIEMLRQREEQSKLAAETKRLADMATAEEARKVEQFNIDARISAEAERVRMEEEKKRQREEKLSQLEAGKKEQWRLEQIKREQRQVSSVGGEEEDNDGQKQTIPQQQQQARPLRIMTGSSGAPAKTKEEDLELTTQIILDYVNSQEDKEGVVDDDDDE